MSNIDTSSVGTWGQERPPRSTLTKIANEIQQIRNHHNDEFRRTIRQAGGSIHALRLRAQEDTEIRQALYRNGWNYLTLEAEMERRTTARWARKVIHGWF